MKELKCEKCNGIGKIEVKQLDGEFKMTIQCPDCQGTGRLYSKKFRKK